MTDEAFEPGERARWVTARINEMPQYVIFLYNTLLDANIEWRFKNHVFATLRYLFDEPRGVIPDDDPLLRRLDDLCMVYRCFAEIVGAMHPASLAVYEEVLHREGVALRTLLPECARFMGRFFFAVTSLYAKNVAELSELAGNSMKTGELVRSLQSYLEGHRPETWDSERMLRVEVFLDRYGQGSAWKKG